MSHFVVRRAHVDMRKLDLLCRYSTEEKFYAVGDQPSEVLEIDRINFELRLISKDGRTDVRLGVVCVCASACVDSRGRRLT